MVIHDPHLDRDALTYSIKLLDGTVPTATGPCALFIDPFGRLVTGLGSWDAPACASAAALKGYLARMAQADPDVVRPGRHHGPGL